MTGNPTRTPFFITLKGRASRNPQDIPQAVRQMERQTGANETPCFAVALNTAGPTVASGATTIAQFDTVILPSSGFLASSSNMQWTCPAQQGGLWNFKASVTFANNAVGRRGSSIHAISLTYDVQGNSWGWADAANNDSLGRTTAAMDLYVVPGDSVDYTLFQTSGVALTYTARFTGFRAVAL